MKILHVIESLDPVKGGPPAIAWQLACAQAKLGHQVVFATYEIHGRQQVIEQSFRADLHPLFHVEWLNGYGLRWESLVGLKAACRLKPLIQDADFVHLHSIWETVLRVAASHCRRQNKPYAVLVNGMLDPWSMSQRTIKKKLALWLAYRRMLNGAAFLHLGNVDEQSLIKPLRLTCPTRIIPNGVTLSEIDPLPSPGGFYAQRPELAGRPFVLFLSRLHYKKGLDYLVNAFASISAKHPRTQLVIAGPDDGYRQPLEQLIAQLKLTDRVHLVGPLYGRQKFEALVDSACFCLPSRQEGFSMAILEALACQKPVVISRDCHFPEVGQAGSGIVCQLDDSASQVALALDRILSDPASAQQMGQIGRRLVEENYTWDRVARRCDECYREFIRS